MKLSLVEEDIWSIYAYTTNRGDCPLHSFLNDTPPNMLKHRNSLIKIFEMVSSNNAGPDTLTDTHSKHLQDGIWEFRHGRLRILWFRAGKNMIICTHGFIKKTKKTPRKEIDFALEKKREHEKQ